MTKALLITTAGQIRTVELGEPLHRSLGALVGGWIEHVNPVGLQKPYCMFVNEDYIAEGLPINVIGSFLYGTQEHGHPICGNIVIMKDGIDEEGEWDVVGLTDQEIDYLEITMKVIRKVTK